jgi:pyroglutamyl-peptidase
MPLTILITGFGPFPGAPFNPTETLVRRLARLRRPAVAEVRLVPHVFDTSYLAVDRDLPRLIAQHAPDAILMFGLAARRRVVTVETRARNAVSMLFSDATGSIARSRAIARNAEPARLFPPRNRLLVRAITAARVPAAPSRDAGRYVCNYLSWRALEAAAIPAGPLVAFAHVPQVRRGALRAGTQFKRLTSNDLAKAGTALLVAIAAEAKRRSR